MTPTELAAAANVSRGTATKWLQGERVGESMAARLAKHAPPPTWEDVAAANRDASRAAHGLGAGDGGALAARASALRARYERDLGLRWHPNHREGVPLTGARGASEEATEEEATGAPPVVSPAVSTPAPSAPAVAPAPSDSLPPPTDAFERLRLIATANATALGHSLARWFVAVEGNPEALSACRACGASVTARVFPGVGEANLAGRAVVSLCEVAQ